MGIITLFTFTISMIFQKWPFPGFMLCTSSVCVCDPSSECRYRDRKRVCADITLSTWQMSNVKLLSLAWTKPCLTPMTCWTDSLWFLFVWPGPKYCSFLKCQPLTNCSVHGANFAQSDRLQCIVQTNWRCSKTKVTWNERTRHSLTNIIFTSFLQYLLIVNSFVNDLVGWQEMIYWHRYSASAYKSIQFRVADKNK